MSYQVRQILEGKGSPVCVKKDDTVASALALMIEHDFSQLPITKEEQGFEFPEGMITYEGVLRGIRNFRLSIDDLRVRDVMVNAKTFTLEDDLFDILDQLKNTNGVLIVSDEIPELVGIVTSYDATEYFRNRTEDLMRVEDIEITIKELIKEAYLDETYEFDKSKLAQAITKVIHRGQGEKPKTFDELTMGEYVNLLTLQDTWDFFQAIFNLPRDSVRELLSGIREIRNSLAHFRGDISAEERDKLKFGIDWLTRCQAQYQERKRIEMYSRMVLVTVEDAQHEKLTESSFVFQTGITSPISSTDFAVTESATGGGRYAALADWLQSQPGKVDQLQLTFNQIEEIIGADLPASARGHRAWWANDSVGHTHSQLWLDAGWRTTYISLSEGRVTFSRIREREKSYITFFSKLLDDLRKKATFDIKDVSPDGASWIVIQKVPRSGQAFGSFTFSFSRDKRLRVELYLDLQDQDQTKATFDHLYAQRDYFESQVGEIEWERLNNRRASRLAVYKDGQITDDKKHTELCRWAVETMIRFYNALLEPTEKAIGEIKNV